MAITKPTLGQDPYGADLLAGLDQLDTRLTDIAYNVKDISFGAKGDGTTDDSAAIQAAISAAHTVGGGTVFLPAGTYKTTSALTLYSGVTLKGESAAPATWQTGGLYGGFTTLSGAQTTPGESTGVTTIKQTSTGVNAINAVNVRRCGLEDIAIEGPVTGTGIGVNVDWLDPSSTLPYYFTMRRVWVHRFGSHGVYYRGGVGGRFDQVTVSDCGGDGFNLPEGGTSNTWTSCVARRCRVGWNFIGAVYQNLSGCSAVFCGVSYRVANSHAIGFYGCGSEYPRVLDTTYNGTSWLFLTNSHTSTLTSCEVIGNPDVAIRVTDGSTMNTFISVADNAPLPQAVNFVKTDSGTFSTVINIRATSPNSYLGRTNVLDDSQGSTQIGYDLTVAHDARVNGSVYPVGSVYLGDGTTTQTDVRWYRTAAARSRITGRLSVDGIGVANAENTTISALAQTKRLPIYDANGDLIGYVPIYT